LVGIVVASGVAGVWKGDVKLSSTQQTLISTPRTAKEIVALARAELAIARPDTEEGRTMARTMGFLLAAVEQIEAEARERAEPPR
jgi:hypothetical protein